MDVFTRMLLGIIGNGDRKRKKRSISGIGIDINESITDSGNNRQRIRVARQSGVDADFVKRSVTAAMEMEWKLAQVGKGANDRQFFLFMG